MVGLFCGVWPSRAVQPRHGGLKPQDLLHDIPTAKRVVRQKCPAVQPSRRQRLLPGGGSELESFALRFAQAVVEVLGAERPPQQLLRCTSARVYADLLRRCARLNRVAAADARRRRLRMCVRSVHVSVPVRGAAEISIRVQHGQRSRAIAARLDWFEGRWQCTDLQFG